MGSGGRPRCFARCSSNSLMTSARAACCQAAIGFSAGWCCISRWMASRAMVTPLTLTVTGFPAGNWTCTEQDMRLLRRQDARALRGFASAVATHHLIAAAAEIPDRGAPDVHKAGKREDKEERHTQEQMRLEDRVRIGDEVGDARLQRKNS